MKLTCNLVRSFPPYKNLSVNLIDDVIITFDDINGRLKVDEARQEAEMRAYSYFKLGLVGMAVVSSDQHFAEVNDKLCQILDYTRKELTRLTWSDITQPEDLQKQEAGLQLIIKGEKDVCTLKPRLLYKNEDNINTTIAVRCIRNEDKSIKHFVAMILAVKQNEK